MRSQTSRSALGMSLGARELEPGIAGMSFMVARLSRRLGAFIEIEDERPAAGAS